MRKERIGELLVQEGRITQAQLEHCLNIQKRTHKRLGEILVRNTYPSVTEEDIAKCLANQSGLPYWDKPTPKVSEETLKKVGLDFFQRYSALPISPNGNIEPSLLITDPSNIDLLEEKGLGNVPKYISTKTVIDSSLEQFVLPPGKGKREIENIVKEITYTGGIGQGALKRLAYILIAEGVRQEASDIHIEPTPETSDIRFRIDGILQPVASLPREVHENIVNVLYSLGGITSAEFGKYQDANFSYPPKEEMKPPDNYPYVFSQPVEIRLSSLPSGEGPCICMRILQKIKTLIPLEKLGYDDGFTLGVINKIIQQPQGIILFTGPTGSGKTTTLYAILSRIRNEDTKILTIEDPIEMELPLAQQIQVNVKGGITFATAIRSFLRHDPDVILIGEIRDKETAQEAMRAALTGHRTFSTLHTIDCFSTLTRLMDLGLDLSYLGLGLSGLVSQRLVRKLCLDCREKIKVPEAYKPLFQDIDYIYQANKGDCQYCYGGYRGRTVVAEALEITPRIKEQMMQKRFVEVRKTIEQMQKEGKFRTLQQDAIRLIKKGMTSIEEVKRVVGIQK